MSSIWKLIYDLDYWLYIGTADDLVNCPDNRKEYQHLVQELKEKSTPLEKIPATVLVMLKKEAELPFYKSRTFWRNLLILLRIV